MVTPYSHLNVKSANALIREETGYGNYPVLTRYMCYAMNTLYHNVVIAVPQAVY